MNLDIVFRILLIRCALAVRARIDFPILFPFIHLINGLCKLDSKILNLDEISLTELLLYDDSKYQNKVNKNTLLASINSVLSTKRFEGQLISRLY